METIEGRDTDYIVSPDGNRLIVHFFTGILEHFREIESFQVVQEEAASMTLRIVPADGFNSVVAERIIGEFRKRGLGDLIVRLEIVQAIPLTAGGKRRFVINELDVEKEDLTR